MRRLILITPALAACVGSGMLTDGTSVSVGHHGRGALRHGRALPVRGEGYVVPPRWRDRGRNYGTDELVGLLARAARRVRREQRGGVLGIADLSPPGGGPTPEHYSHHSGRDVDIIFYATDAAGKPLPPEEMVPFGADGHSISRPEEKPADASAPASPSELVDSKDPPVPRQFDVRRNWALIRALITDDSTHVQWIFIGAPLARSLLDHARRAAEPRWLVDRAAKLMHQPGDAGNHMDHLHVRVFCAPSDRHQGCTDRGPARWLKKTLKYTDMPPSRPVLPALRALALPLTPYPLL